MTESTEDDTIDQAEDTMTIIEKFVDNIKEEHINNDKLKTVLKCLSKWRKLKREEPSFYTYIDINIEYWPSGKMVCSSLE